MSALVAVERPDDLQTYVPSEMRAAMRWLAWRYDAQDPTKKPPIDERGRKMDATDPTTWLSFKDAQERAARHGGGVGFVLGGGISGVDLDDCLDPVTRKLHPMAEDILHHAGCYAEVSPSGKGLKLFGRSDLPGVELHFPRDAGAPKVTKEFGPGAYFTVTGDAVNAEGLGDLKGVLLTYQVEDKKRGHKKAPSGVVERGGQHDALVAEAGALRKRHHDDTATFAMLRAWADKRFDPCPSDADIQNIVESSAAWRQEPGEAAFAVGSNGIPQKTQGNIRLALPKLGVLLREDLFARSLVYEIDGKRANLDDATVTRLWLALDRRFGFLPTRTLFAAVAEDMARSNPFHPVRDYLDGLEWDGKARVDEWLVAYGRATNTEYIRAVGALVLVAAVRRVRQPGCKFDELLILESGQGLDKSSALRTLCPREEWFSDSLALGSDAKKTIEGTAGIWIMEASDLQGKSRRDVEELKASLSRQVDGPVRLAYGRLAETVPRQFVVIGTTNRTSYLTDSTGNRRFWPVAVEGFDLDALRRDRDQLWAEAAHREAAGESIRLPRQLWPVAAQHQEARRVEDPWEELLEQAVGGKDRISSDDVWNAVGVPKDRRTQDDNLRLGAAMKRLGFKSSSVRIGRETKRGYKRTTTLLEDRPNA